MAKANNLRKISGWNIYQREQIKELGCLGPASYKTAINAIGLKWQSLSQDDRDAFEVQAQYEAATRDQVVQTPLPSSVECRNPKSEGEIAIGTSALKRLSVARLQKNYGKFASHSAWSMPNQLGESSFPTIQTFHFFGWSGWR